MAKRGKTKVDRKNCALEMTESIEIEFKRIIRSKCNVETYWTKENDNGLLGLSF